MMFQWLLDWIFSAGLGLPELARRLDWSQEAIKATDKSYCEFEIIKKSGKPRKLAAPNPDLKKLQRRMLRRLLAKLQVHPQATGFEPGISFVDNARCHQSQVVVIRVDLINFFPSIRRDQVETYFRRIGWNRKAARLLADLTTWQGALPQGAPTSPRLSNLVNYGFDVALAGLAKSYEGIYTRYADDITISLSDERADVHELIEHLLRMIREWGYRPHIGRKFDVRRRHQRQIVTGLVVNDRANLSREQRRWIRAVDHRTKQRGSGGLCKPPSIGKQQLAGWKGLQRMIEKEAE